MAEGVLGTGVNLAFGVKETEDTEVRTVVEHTVVWGWPCIPEGPSPGMRARHLNLYREL